MNNITKNQNIKTIYFGGGCFWGTQSAFKLLSGVVDTQVGYANGNTSKTQYQNLSQTNHAEVVKIEYNKNIIRLSELILRYFSIINPFTLNNQGNDFGTQYRTGIYYQDDEDLKIIDRSMKIMKKIYNRKIFVEVEKIKNYVTAEAYHQNYLDKNPFGYCHINPNDILEPLWDDKDFQKIRKEDLKNILDEESYAVMKENKTELPFTSKFNNNEEQGIYVDKISGEPLFSSSDKFDAGCGWPSFTRPITTDLLKENSDYSHNMIRTEVRTKISDSHLGHVFDDGITAKGGLRYCINGVALKFIPLDEMEESGYLKFIPFVYD
ncbi:MAG: peptide-methionine (R)-S-oxide reductase MsrB [Clostridia bacterium]|nr:peptide-methionine (R)-S-oxide reductase MsrB [Clostridia bacterium]